MSQSSSARAATVPMVNTPGGSFLRDLLDSFFFPSERFGRLSARPRWVAALLVLAFLSMFITYLHQNMVPYATQVQAKIDQTEKVAGPLSNAEKDRRMAQHPGIASQAAWLAFIGTFTGVVVLVCALAFWVAVIVTGEDMRFSTIFSIAANSMLPSSLAWTLCATAVLLIKDPGTIDPVRLDNVVMSNLGVVFNLGESHPFLQSVLGSIDVFSMWTAVLVAIGISVCARKTRLSKSLFVVAAVWGIYIVAKGLLAMWMPGMA